jgi:hypothetical protein
MVVYEDVATGYIINGLIMPLFLEMQIKLKLSCPHAPDEESPVEFLPYN